MKKYLLFYCIISAFLTLNAQAYQPLLVEGNKWHLFKYVDDNWCPDENISCPEPNSQVLYISGEIIINNVTYKKIGIEYANQIPNCTNYLDTTDYEYLREDTTEKKVYRWNGTSEEILYDFSLNVGDSSPLESIITPYQVFGMGYGTVFDIHVKYFNLNPSNEIFAGNTMVYEGIGSCNGLLYSPYGFSFECGFWLEGFETSNGISWNSEFLDTDDVLHPTFNQMVFYYSKLNNNYQIKSKNDQNLAVKLFSSNGNLVEDFNIPSNQEFTTKITQKGIYFYQIVDENNKVWKGKFIKN